MIEDLQYFFYEQQHAPNSKDKSQKYVQANNQDTIVQNQQEIHDGIQDDDYDEGPVLALLMLQGSRFKNMVDLNYQNKKMSSDSINEQIEQDEGDDQGIIQVEETNTLKITDEEEEDQQQRQFFKNNNVKNLNKNNEEIEYFHTEGNNYEIELQELPFKLKSQSTVINFSQTGESPILLKQEQTSTHIKQIIEHLKEQNTKIKTLDFNNLKGKSIDQNKNSEIFRNTKSTLASNIVSQTQKIENESDSLDPTKINLSKQKSMIKEDRNDLSQSQIQCKRRKKLSSTTHKLKFKWIFFLEFLFYHFLYMGLFGPLASIFIVYVFKQSKILCQNMGFIGINKPNIYQGFLFIFYTLSIIIYFTIPQDIQTDYLIYLITFFYTYFIKIIIQALKYGFYSCQQMKTIKTKVIPWKEQRKEFIFGMWIDQDDEIINDEIEAAMQRLEIEASSFYLEFMSRPSKEKLEKLIAHERKSVLLSNQEKTIDIKELPYGKNLLLEYIRYYRNKFNPLWVKKIGYTVSVIRQCYFITVKVNNVMSIDENKAQLYIINILFGILEFVFWANIISILLLYFQDLKRKTFILNQMSHLISAKRVDIELEGEKKLYPTLELVCPISLRTWAALRKITLEYGEKFSQRIQILISTFGSFFLIITIIYILQYFEIIQWIDLPVQVIYLYIFDICCITIIIIKCVFMGGQINEHFDIHTEKLYKNKLIFTELLSKYDIWFKEDYVVVNPLYRRLISDYTQMQNTHRLNEEELKQFIRDNIKICSLHILDIQIQSKDNPYKVFGVAMTRQLGLTIITALISLLFSLVGQYIYSKPDVIQNIT